MRIRNIKRKKCLVACSIFVKAQQVMQFSVQVVKNWSSTERRRICPSSQEDKRRYEVTLKNNTRKDDRRNDDIENIFLLQVGCLFSRRKNVAGCPSS